MAQHTVVIMVDDLDESEADETLRFGLDGVEYEIDLNDEHAADLRAALEPFVAAARKVGGRKIPARQRRVNGDEPSASEVREWARKNGWDIPNRGRVSAEVRAAYAEAH